MSEPCSLLWCDIETTGLSRSRDLLLEIACFITDPNGDNPREYRNWIIRPHKLWASVMNDFVREMHDKSGLSKEVNELGIHLLDWRDDFEYYLNKNLILPEQVGPKFTMAGSGVGPFDLPYLTENFPWITPFFNYYVMDIGVIGRFIRQILGAKLEERPVVGHRAMDDIKEHYAEFLEYKELLSL